MISHITGNMNSMSQGQTISRTNDFLRLQMKTKVFVAEIVKKTVTVTEEEKVKGTFAPGTCPEVSENVISFLI